MKRQIKIDKIYIRNSKEMYKDKKFIGEQGYRLLKFACTLGS